MKIMGGAAEKEATDKGEGRIADPSVFPGHGTGDDLSPTPWHAAAHDEVGAGTEFLDKGFDRSEVVAEVRVAHDEESSVGGFHTCAEGVAVAFFGDIDNAGTKRAGYVLGSISAAIVGDEDFTFDSGICKASLCGGNAIGESFRLVEAGHENGNFHMLELISTFAGLQNGFGFILGSSLGEDLSAPLGDLAADLGRGAVHG